jgi:ATP-dependent exoDNAse (exonuclease V) beta subunit
VLYFLAPGKEKHQTIAAYLENPQGFLLDRYGFETEYVRHASVYDGLEYAIRCFSLAEKSDAYLTFLLDEVFTLEQNEGSSIPSFLQFWEQHKGKLSIVAPEAMNAIQIMTIHKAKGLEFPIVIYPYASTDIYSSRREKDTYVWLPVAPEQHAGFSELLLSKKKEMTTYNEVALQLYDEEQQKLELDAFNLLYVALTRAEKALFVLSESDLDKEGKPKTNYFSGLFIHYLMEKGIWDKDLTTFSFGELLPREGAVPIPGNTLTITHQYSFRDRPELRIITRSGMLWETERQEAISGGNLLHELMARIETGGDIETAISALLRKGMVKITETGELRELALSVINHPALSPYYRNGLLIRNESEIFTEKGRILRPDRIVFQEKKATIIDYKRGKKNPGYAMQLYDYADALESMGFKVENKIIVYINEEVNPQFI